MAIWDRLLASCVDQGEAELAAALTACSIDTATPGKVVLRALEHRDTMILANEPERIEAFVASALSRLMGQPIELEILLQQASGANARRGRYRDAEHHPLVQKLMDTFDAEVLAFEPMDSETWERELRKLCTGLLDDSPEDVEG